MGAALEGLISSQFLQANQHNCALSLSVALDDHNTPHTSSQDTVQDKSFIVEDPTDSVEQNKTFSATSNSSLSGYDERGRKSYTCTGQCVQYLQIACVLPQPRNL